MAPFVENGNTTTIAPYVAIDRNLHSDLESGSLEHIGDVPRECMFCRKMGLEVAGVVSCVCGIGRGIDFCLFTDPMLSLPLSLFLSIWNNLKGCLDVPPLRGFGILVRPETGPSWGWRFGCREPKGTAAPDDHR